MLNNLRFPLNFFFNNQKNVNKQEHKLCFRNDILVLCFSGTGWTCSVLPSFLEANNWKSTLNLQQIRVFQVGIYEDNERDLGRKTFLNAVSVPLVLPFRSFLYCYILVPSSLIYYSQLKLAEFSMQYSLPLIKE